MFPALIHTSTHLKGGIFGVPRLHGRESQFSIITPWKFSFQPAYVDLYSLSRCRKILSQDKGTCFSKAIFVPSISTYNKVTSGPSVVPSDISSRDLSWQFSLQRLWEKIAHGIDTDSLLEKSIKMDGAETLPRREFLYEDAANCSPADGYLACSAVIPSLPLTIKWLRNCVRENPSLRLQVLVTGSLHLVGDVLKLIRR